MALTLSSAAPAQRLVALEAVQLGETIAAGTFVYRKSSDGLHYKADNNISTAEADVVGILLQGGVANDWRVAGTSGKFTVDSVMTAGENYLLSNDVASQLETYANLTGGDVEYITYLGVALDTDEILLGIQATGLTKA